MERRNTKQLDLIRDFACHSKSHPTAEDVYNVIVQYMPDVSLRTVYRNLNKLADSGELRKIQVANGPDRFDSTLAPHQHILCTECGEFIDIFLENEDIITVKLKGLCGYEITDVDIVFRGVCPNCK